MSDEYAPLPQHGQEQQSNEQSHEQLNGLFNGQPVGEQLPVGQSAGQTSAQPAVSAQGYRLAPEYGAYQEPAASATAASEGAQRVQNSQGAPSSQDSHATQPFVASAQPTERAAEHGADTGADNDTDAWFNPFAQHPFFDDQRFNAGSAPRDAANKAMNNGASANTGAASSKSTGARQGASAEYGASGDTAPQSNPFAAPAPTEPIHASSTAPIVSDMPNSPDASNALDAAAMPSLQQNQPQQPQSQQPELATQRAHHGVASTAFTALAAAFIAAALCLGLGYAALINGWVSVPAGASMASIGATPSGNGTAAIQGDKPIDWVGVARNVSGSVVAIQTKVDKGVAKGSGAILDAQGHIVTNNHVVAQSDAIEVTLSNGQMYTAKVVGADTTTDLAVIKIDNPPRDLKPVQFADSEKLAVGEGVMAIGNPLGYDDTATTGIVSALNRPVSVMSDNQSEIVTNAVQIDAAINPGNSGGPTFNAAGQVIGINSSIASTATSSAEAGSIGIGFAIPSDLVNRIAHEIIERGSATHVTLGVVIKSAVAQAGGIARGGAQITNPGNGSPAVVPDSPAAKAGLKLGDTIVAFNGHAVNNNYSLLGFVRAAALNSRAKLTVVRGQSTIELTVVFDKAEAARSGNNRAPRSNSRRGGNNNNGNNGGDGEGNGARGNRHNGQEGHNNQNDQNQGGQGSQGGQGGDNDFGDGGGIFDPFGLW